MRSYCSMDAGVGGAADADAASRATPARAASTPRESGWEPTGDDPVRRDVDVRLEDAAATGETLELVVVLRGTVHRQPGRSRPQWRVRLPNGHYRVLSADSILAATPSKTKGRLSR